MPRTKTTRRNSSSRTTGRKTARRALPSPVLVVSSGGYDVTPIEHRLFSREYEIDDSASGLRILAAESGRPCEGCDWCSDGADEAREHAERDPNQAYVGIFARAQDKGSENASFEGYVSAKQLHAMITHLSTVRDRMVADGALAPRIDLERGKDQNQLRGPK